LSPNAEIFLDDKHEIVNTARKSLSLQSNTENRIQNATSDQLRHRLSNCEFGSNTSQFCELFQCDKSNFSKWLKNNKGSIASKNTVSSYLKELMKRRMEKDIKSLLHE
jgi:hypothetical protein